MTLLRRIRLWLLLALCLPGWALAAAADRCAPQVLSVQAARAATDDGGRPVGGWQNVSLPDIWTHRWPGHTGAVWYQVDWTPGCAHGQPTGLRIDDIRMAAEVYLGAADQPGHSLVHGIAAGRAAGRWHA